MSLFVIAQIVSVITIITTVLALFQKEKFKTMILFTISNISMMATYSLLGRWLSLILVGIAGVRTFIYYLYAVKNLKPNYIVMVAFEVVLVIVSILLWEDYLDLLMLINLCMLTYMTWQDNMKLIRAGYVVSALLLITYDILVKAYVGMISEVILLVSSAISIIRYDIKGRIIQVADKGLNCGDNIFSAAVEANDGYIFSKSVHGNNLSKEEKTWVLLSDNDENKWFTVRDEKNNILYRYKCCVDTFKYDHTVDGKKVPFSVKEKRVVTYNPTLAKKKRLEIQKEVEKAKEKVTLKSMLKDEFGDCAKYVTFEAVNKNGKKTKIAKSINEDKIDEDMSLAGFNLIVTSEVNMSPMEIYNVYHGLWRIEESFRVMKTYLEARPAFLQTEASVYGHFLICYLSLTILRLLELKIFNDELPIGQIIEFIRNYKITFKGNNSYINNASLSRSFSYIKEKLGLIKLGNLELFSKDLDNLFSIEL